MNLHNRNGANQSSPQNECKEAFIWGQKTLTTTTPQITTLKRYIIDALNHIMEPFGGACNDRHTRMEIKNRVITFLTELIYTRTIRDFDVICDERNNTSEVINSHSIGLNVYVTPTRSTGDLIFSNVNPSSINVGVFDEPTINY